MFFDNYCVNGKYISMGPKKSIQTNISKIVLFTMTTVLVDLSSYYPV